MEPTTTTESNATVVHGVFEQAWSLKELAGRLKVSCQAGQKVTLEATIAGAERAVSTSTRAPFKQALVEVRDDLIRQLTDAKNRTEPRQNRMWRDTEP